VLYEPGAFEPLTERGWDESFVRRGIQTIVDDATSSFDPERLWPADEWDAWQSQLPLTSLYAGASGVLWGLGFLQRRGYDVRLDLAAASRLALEAWRAAPDQSPSAQMPLPAEHAASLWLGESGILVVAWQLAPSDDLADDLHARVLENVENEANELMWGSPGTLLAACAMLERTGDERWTNAWHRTADVLWDRRDEDGLWTQELYGRTVKGLGPAHGLAGIALALLHGDLLDEARRRELLLGTAAVLARNAIQEDGLATWPSIDGRREVAASDGTIRLQWCHGAPGIVASASSYLDEELVLAGAEVTWQAGAHGSEKGVGICHGTAGNGYALLKTFERTGDERWLERARRFAVHALEQAARMRAERGRGRYSLWTGELGAALFAAEALEGRARVPTLDSWD
jgi:Lanthionine synthetase C-like protein